MIPINRSYCSILSGGVDSSLVSHYLSKICNPKKYLTINHVNKDKISNNIHLFKPFFGKKIQQLKISESDYYKYLQKSLKICSSPINSHDFPGKLFLAKQAKALKTKAILVVMEQTNYLEDMKHIDRKLVIISAIILITQNILIGE